jgi:excisionase family DNA binding protein|tara:strand:- start:5 stop:202 length:198 start_codon:yes stop_codon:yes gene_type:complete
MVISTKTKEAKFGDYWLSTKEVESYTSVSNKTLARAINRGKLKVSKATGKNLFKKSWVDRWLENK